MRKLKTYTLFALSGYALLLVVFLCNALLLFRSGELYTTPELVKRQQTQKAIVNSLHNSLLHLKHQSYRYRDPEVVTIGTSRAMQFREHHFRRSFYNLAGVDGRPERYQRLYKNLLAGQPPKVAIVVLDFWDYCARTDSPSAAPITDTQLPASRQSSILRLPLDLLASGKLEFSAYVSLLWNGFPETNGLEFIGIPAAVGRHGFAKDGSRYKFVEPTHRIGVPLERRWAETLDRIKSGTSNFRRGCSLDHAKVDRLLFGFVDRLKSSGTSVILVFAPLPKVTLTEMESHGRGYDYVDNLRRYVMSNATVPVLDYHRGSALGSADCEFRDGFHGGEVTYMRMLIDAAKQQDSPLADYVDLPFLENAVAKGAGRLTIGSKSLRESMPEYFEQEAGAEGCREAQ